MISEKKRKESTSDPSPKYTPADYCWRRLMLKHVFFYSVQASHGFTTIALKWFSANRGGAPRPGETKKEEVAQEKAIQREVKAMERFQKEQEKLGACRRPPMTGC